MLKLWEIGGYNFPYFSKEKFLTKSHLVQQFTGDNELAKYLPDEINPSTVTRSFLFALLFNVQREKYINLYKAYKEKKKEYSTTHGKLYKIEVSDAFVSHIKDFNPTIK